MNTPAVQFVQMTACLVPMCAANSVSKASHSLVRMYEPESRTRSAACRISSLIKGRERGIFFMVRCRSTGACARIPELPLLHEQPGIQTRRQQAAVDGFPGNRQTQLTQRVTVLPAKIRVAEPLLRSL